MTTLATTRTTNQPKTDRAMTAKEAIAANVQCLIEQLEAGHSDALTAYLNAMSRFHNYSFGNILEIARQRPDATRVAGLWAWNQLGRKVKKGEKGIRILAPIIGVRRKTRGRGREGHHQAEHPRGGGFPSGLCLRCLADRRRGIAGVAGDQRRRGRQPRPSAGFH